MSRREASVPRDTLQGTLDLLVLRTLARGPEHGYGITCHILAVSQNRLRVEEGSLTRAGEKRLAEAVQNWRQHTAVVAAFLDFA